MFEWFLCNTRELFRDRSNIFFIIIFPILLVTILGNMLSNLDNPDPRLGTIRIAYSIADMETGADDPAVQMERTAQLTAIEEFLAVLRENEEIELVKTADKDAARAAAESGDADAAMIFKTPLSIGVAEGEELYRNRAVSLMAQSFAREYAAYTAAAEHDPAAFASALRDGMPDFSGLAVDKDLGIERSMMDYYAVTMIVMIAFMGGGIGGASQMHYARQNGLLRRMSASPYGRTRLFLDAVLGVIPQNILQAGIVMSLSLLFLGVHYTKSWQGNLLLFGFFIVLGTAVGAVFLIIGLFMRTNPTVPLMIIFWGLLFMAGTFNKDTYIEGFSEYLPMNIAQRAVFEMTLFGRTDQLFLVMGVSAVIIAASCVIGSVLFKRKEIMS